MPSPKPPVPPRLPGAGEAPTVCFPNGSAQTEEVRSCIRPKEEPTCLGSSPAASKPGNPGPGSPGTVPQTVISPVQAEGLQSRSRTGDVATSPGSEKSRPGMLRTFTPQLIIEGVASLFRMQSDGSDSLPLGSTLEGEASIFASTGSRATFCRQLSEHSAERVRSQLFTAKQKGHRLRLQVSGTALTVFVVSVLLVVVFFTCVDLPLAIILSGWVCLVCLASLHCAVYPSDHVLARVMTCLGGATWIIVSGISGMVALMKGINGHVMYEYPYWFWVVDIGVWVSLSVFHLGEGLRLMYKGWALKAHMLLEVQERSVILEQTWVIVCASISDVGLLFAWPDKALRTLWYWFNVVAPRILTLMWFKYNVKNYVNGWLVGSDAGTKAAAAIAALVSGGDGGSSGVLRQAKANFRYISCDQLTRENLATNASNNELYGLSVWAPLGFVDAFVSHSWHDDAEAKWCALQAWRREFKALHRGREPRLWVDKFCIDQGNIDVNLQCLPIYLAGCQTLVVFVGSTYFERLWCVMEVFVYLAMGRTRDDFTFRALTEGTDEVGIYEQINSFNAVNAKCFVKADKDRLLSIVESSFGNIKTFNCSVKSMLLDASGVLRVTPSAPSDEEVNDSGFPNSLLGSRALDVALEGPFQPPRRRSGTASLYSLHSVAEGDEAEEREDYLQYPEDVPQRSSDIEALSRRTVEV